MDDGTTLRSQYIRTRDGLPLAVFEAGPSSAPPVVFLHGFGYSHAAFLPQFDSHLARDFRLIAPDLRGHGYSAKPWRAEDYAGSEVWADDLEHVLKILNVTNATLVGWSYGAMVCMDWLRKYGPHRAKSFIFTGSHGGLVPYTEEQSANKKEINAQFSQLTPDHARDIQNARDFVDTMIHKAIPTEWRESLLLSRQMLPLYAQQAMGGRSFENRDLRDTIARPIMFIQGERDFANPPETIHTAASSLPMSRVEILPGVGHVPPLEAPDRFNALVASFAADEQQAEAHG